MSCSHSVVIGRFACIPKCTMVERERERVGVVGGCLIVSGFVLPNRFVFVLMFNFCTYPFCVHTVLCGRCCSTACLCKHVCLCAPMSFDAHANPFTPSSPPPARKYPILTYTADTRTIRHIHSHASACIFSRIEISCHRKRIEDQFYHYHQLQETPSPYYQPIHITFKKG